MMELLARHASTFGVTLTTQQRAAFQIYGDELVAWNEHTNLTAIADPDGVQVKHFLDSLSCLLAFPPDASPRAIDVGTGAGFPGLPIRIMRPDVRLTLLESVGKKVSFLHHIVGALEIGNVAIIHGRAEDAGQSPDHREVYDVVLARAVAELRVLAELTLPLCRVGGIVIAQKRDGDDDEIANAAQALATLGGAIHNHIPISLPGVEARQLIVLTKLNPTPARYPRRAGMPEKRPL
jgi:16S rRNA (guanine527-N7)-methyltransferase